MDGRLHAITCMITCRHSSSWLLGLGLDLLGSGWIVLVLFLLPWSTSFSSFELSYQPVYLPPSGVCLWRLESKCAINGCETHCKLLVPPCAPVLVFPAGVAHRLTIERPLVSGRTLVVTLHYADDEALIRSKIIK